MTYTSVLGRLHGAKQAGILTRLQCWVKMKAFHLEALLRSLHCLFSQLQRPLQALTAAYIPRHVQKQHLLDHFQCVLYQIQQQEGVDDCTASSHCIIHLIARHSTATCIYTKHSRLCNSLQLLWINHISWLGHRSPLFVLLHLPPVQADAMRYLESIACLPCRLPLHNSLNVMCVSNECFGIAAR